MFVANTCTREYIARRRGEAREADEIAGRRYRAAEAREAVSPHLAAPCHACAPLVVQVVIDMSMSLDGFVAAPRAVARGKDIRLGGASPGKQALAAGLCDEILIHLAPCLLGGGVRLFDALPDGIRLEKLSVSDGPFATHLRYRVNWS